MSEPVDKKPRDGPSGGTGTGGGGVGKKGGSKGASKKKATAPMAGPDTAPRGTKRKPDRGPDRGATKHDQKRGRIQSPNGAASHGHASRVAPAGTQLRQLDVLKRKLRAAEALHAKCDATTAKSRGVARSIESLKAKISVIERTDDPQSSR